MDREAFSFCRPETVNGRTAFADEDEDLASRFSTWSDRNSSPSNRCVAALPFFARRKYEVAV